MFKNAFIITLPRVFFPVCQNKHSLYFYVFNFFVSVYFVDIDYSILLVFL